MVFTHLKVHLCLGYQDTQPNRPGSCLYEYNDAQTYLEWGVDAVKDDGCGPCRAPWETMMKA